MDDKTTETILRRLSNLETHIINLIHPIQNISTILTSKKSLENVERILTSTLKIDDSNLNRVLECFGAKLKTLEKNLTDFSLGNIDFKQTFNEIKYIGNRLNEIEKTLKNIKYEGLNQPIILEINHKTKKVNENNQWIYVTEFLKKYPKVKKRQISYMRYLYESKGLDNIYKKKSGRIYVHEENCLNKIKEKWTSFKL